MRVALVTLLLLLPTAFAQKWQVSYFYDDASEVLHFSDLAFPSADRGIAVGSIVDEGRRKISRHVAVVTADGGKQWTQVPLKGEPISLFFLDSSNGWLVADDGIWKTEEAGRSWRKLGNRNGLLRVWFLDANHGFGAGEGSVVQETRDGGKLWKKIKVDFKLPGKSQVVLNHIAFVTPRVGLIVGESYNTLLQLQTKDGGATWETAAASVNYRVRDLKLRGDDGLALFTGSQGAFHLDLRTGKSRLSYRSADRQVSSSVLFEGRSFLAAAPLASRTSTPKPYDRSKKITVLESRDFRTWKEMKVDYRAEGGSVILAGPDAEHVFMATDQGMILRLE